MYVCFVMDIKAVAAAYIYMHLHLKNKNKKRSRRRWWQCHMFSKRSNYGGNPLISDLRLQHSSGHFHNFTRMSPDDFDLLRNLIGPIVAKKDTVLREAVSVEERLAVTLRFLATGDSYSSLQYLFKISKQLISTIVPEVCEALITVLKDNIKIPTMPEGWIEISENFNKSWNFPHTLGAMDGKHVVLQAPCNSGSEFFNYKSTFSIVLFAVVDSEYNFIFVDAGCQGRISDGGIFQNCELNKKLQNKSLVLPTPEILPGGNRKVPYFFIGDGAFQLTENIMKPFPGLHAKGTPERIYNYRLSRARRTVENVFGIVSSVFRVLRKPMLLQPEKAELIVLATAHLHNFLRRNKRSASLYTPTGTFDSEIDGNLVKGTWRQMNDSETTSLLSIRNIPRKSGSSAIQIREELKQYCVENGRLSWQDQYA